MNFRSLLSVTLLLAVVASGATSADRAKKPRAAGPAAALLKAVNELDLNDDQKAKVKALGEEYSGKIAAAMEKATGSLTAEQKQARAELMKQAKAENKDRKTLAAELKAKIKLTPEQEKAMEEGRKESSELLAKLRQSIEEVLTAEQKAKLPKGRKAAK